ncbi:MAG TPA: bifunctional homocysteine S-methyltransferase/methylenetetrahydrofolate reductase, partial [Myxococcales bacterium]|nr:bifunctional homocysteine S-methyltransferase/methylenetetrahydrofolate reductase [Myxococcales bacterium]
MSRYEQFADALQSGVLVCDGAMGTELYNRGISFDLCFDEFSISRPDLVRSIHEDYKFAGAQILLTNTFGSNIYRLSSHGFEEKVTEINAAAAALARSVAKESSYVAGSIGPLGKRLAPVGQISIEDAQDAFAEQMTALANGGVDLFFLETFSDLHEVEAAMAAWKRVASEIPLVAHMTFTDEGKTLHGYKPEEVAQAMTEMGALAVGANCSVGPQGLMEVIERMLRVPDIKLSSQPNAGLPQFHHGRYVYITSPDYMAESAKQFVQMGCHLVGGCCGTGPAHVRAMRSMVEGMTPTRPKRQLHIDASDPEIEIRRPPTGGQRNTLREKLDAGEFVSSVEIDPPKGINVEKLVRGAELCRSSGVDCINIADSPLARARMSHTALATIIRREVDIEIILHMSCRDRNLIGLQSEIMGAYALGIRNILCVTGDPPQVGDYPNATGVFDIDSVGLTKLCARLNRGVDLADREIRYQTDIFIGVASNPTSNDLEAEFAHFGNKSQAGAHFTMTQPIYELDSLKRFLDECKPTVPILVGVLPLRNARHASFLHNEVPGMFIPQGIRDRMTKAGDDGPQEGVAIAQEFLAEAKKLCQGVYLMP